MLRAAATLALAALLLAPLALALPAGQESAQIPGNVHLRSDTNPWANHPLHDVDWDHFIVTGGFRTEAQAAAAEAEDDEFHDSDLLPLGDVTGNGRADVLRADWWEDRTQFQAISSRDGSTLWQIESEEDGYLFLIGDADRDGVNDIARVTSDDQGRFQSSLTGFRMDASFTARYEILSGVDLAPLADLDLTGQFIWTSDGVQAIVAFSGESSYSFSFPFLVVHPDLPGFLVLEQEIRMEENWLLNVQGMGYGQSTFMAALGLAHHAPDGSVQWTTSLSDDGTYLFLTDFYDYDGDGVGDFLVSGTQFPTSPAVHTPLGPLYLEGDGNSRVVAHLLSGADGGALLHWQSAPFENGDGVVLPVGDGGNGQELAAHILLFEGGLLEPYRITMHIQFLDLDGTELRATTYQNELVVAGAFGDLNGDGVDEIALTRMTIQPSSPFLGSTDMRFGIADRDSLSYHWSIDLVDEWPLVEIYNVRAAPDMTGDGIPDILTISGLQGEEISFNLRAGTTGDHAWQIPIDEDRVTAIGMLPDLDGVGAADLYMVEFPDGHEEGEWGLGPGFLHAMRGSDATRYWTTQIFTPAEDVTVGYPWAYVLGAGDVRGDGADDLIVNLDGASHRVTCDSGYCEAEPVEGPRVDLAFVLGGVDGRFIPLDAASQASYSAHGGDPEQGPAGEGLRKQYSTPAPGLFLVLAGLALLVGRRR